MKKSIDLTGVYRGTMKSTLQILSILLVDSGSINSLFWAHKRTLANFFLVTCGVYYAFGAVYSLVFMNLDEIQEDPTVKDMAHELFKCISIWNYIVQISFYIGYNINSYQLTTYPPDHWWMKYAKGYRRFLEKSFLSVVFPLSLFVCNTFWYVYHTNRDMIYPKDLEELVPAWYNHTMHTLPVLIVFLHLILVEPESSPPCIRTSIFIQTAFHAGYLSMLLFCRYMDGVWLYKFLGYYAESWTRSILATLFMSIVSPNVYVWIGYKTYADVRQRVSKINMETKAKALDKLNNNNNDVDWKLK
ncbi:uncharacterized protein LOC103525018 isoform X1 [Diaphorina citri]|uniref:Uncharacterized protein LOC103525018 isoform X1 n=2 Tax=Diaphorina citri TaxID=121845 RepID=A0A1S3DWF7_DIACI|nr:uncharacterized protein LOC103525018 isoform X1 [Diaphorina citri]KAI5755754.1 hypothetical protein M8J77_019398 [Diaphorina citri]